MPKPTETALSIEPTPRPIEFDSSKQPPEPKGLTRVSDPRKVLKVAPFEGDFSDRQVSALRQRAEADARARALLGERYAFMFASLADVGDKNGAMPKYEIRLEYFNYATNRAVHIWGSESLVTRVQEQPDGYQPPESDEEIEAAAAIVRSEAQFAEATADLPVRGILTQGPKGRRYLYLMFKKPQEPAAFDATVDITTGTIVRAGPIAHFS